MYINVTQPSLLGTEVVLFTLHLTTSITPKSKPTKHEALQYVISHPPVTSFFIGSNTLLRTFVPNILHLPIFPLRARPSNTHKNRLNYQLLHFKTDDYIT